MTDSNKREYELHNATNLPKDCTVFFCDGIPFPNLKQKIVLSASLNVFLSKYNC